MGFHGECGRGWAVRCAKAKSKRCRCRCHGANHGRSNPTFQITLDLESNFRVEESQADRLIIRDLGPWDQHKTVTNDAANVVASLASQLGQRRLFYYDSEGRMDELLVRGGQFAGFARGPAPLSGAGVAV